MANKRMFSVDVVETDAFLELPSKSQLLYFHLGMRADDDGFVSSPRAIMRTTGCTARDLTRLETAGYVISFDSGVLVVTDWKVNNFLRKDRHAGTVHQNELKKLIELSNGRYILNTSGQPVVDQMTTSGQPKVNHRSTQYSIEENSIERSSKKEAATAAPDPQTDTGLAAIIQYFQEAIGDFPRSALDKLQRWREVYPAELICKAIDEAAENNVRKWRYVDGILKSWQDEGVKTLGDVAARRDARKKPEQGKVKKLEVLE